MAILNFEAPGKFDFIDNNGLTRKTKTGDFEEVTFKYMGEELKRRSIIRKVESQFWTEQGPTQLGWCKFYNSEGEVLAEGGEFIDDADTKVTLIEENERLIGYKCRISSSDPAELHDI